MRTPLRYADLAAHPKARLDPPAEVTAIDLRLTGDMIRSNWAFNDLALADLDPIEVVAGQWYSLNIENATTMWHPIHLHGHTPQLGAAAGGVRKDTVNVLPETPSRWCSKPRTLGSGCCTVTTHITSNRAWRPSSPIAPRVEPLACCAQVAGASCRAAGAARLESDAAPSRGERDGATTSRRPDEARQRRQRVHMQAGR